MSVNFKTPNSRYKLFIGVIIFLNCRILSARVLFFLPGHTRNHFRTSTLWAIARLNFEEHIKQAGQLTETLLLFYKNSPEENKGSSKHLRFCGQRLFGLLHSIAIPLKFTWLSIKLR